MSKGTKTVVSKPGAKKAAAPKAAPAKKPAISERAAVAPRVAKPAPKATAKKPAPKAPAKKPAPVTIVSLRTVMRDIPKRPISMVREIKLEKPLSATELKKAEKALLALRDKFYRSADSARQNVRHNNEADNSGDDGASIFDKFLALERAGNTKDFLNRVDEALARIKDGTYGKCLNCGNPIRRARLDVRPFSRYCIKCQELLEKNQMR